MLVAVSTSADDFQAAWDRFGAAMRRARSQHGSGVDGPLSIPQYHLVEPLRDGRVRSVRELAERACVSPPTASRMLDGLERDGLVERRPSEVDRRRVEVLLSEAGAAALAEQRRIVEAKRRRLAAALEPHERAELARLLDRLADVLEQA
jgi:DNA-binding MarR family transcriptional regulator